MSLCHENWIALLHQTLSRQLVCSLLHCAGESAASAVAVEEGADLDYFDLEDLGRLRRDVRRAIENVQRERELYHEIVLRYLKACLYPPNSLPHMPVPPKQHGQTMYPVMHDSCSLHAGV